MFTQALDMCLVPQNLAKITLKVILRFGQPSLAQHTLYWELINIILVIAVIT